MHEKTRRIKSAAKWTFIVVTVFAFQILVGENTPESWIVPTFKTMVVVMFLSGLLYFFAETISALWNKQSK